MAKDVTKEKQEPEVKPTEGTVVTEGTAPLDPVVEQAKPIKVTELDNGTVKADY